MYLKTICLKILHKNSVIFLQKYEQKFYVYEKTEFKKCAEF